MKKIGIFCYILSKEYKWDENSLENRTVGESEVWAIEISNELALRGHEVYLFGNPFKNHKSVSGVFYYTIDDFIKVNNEVLFDEIIFSRTVEHLNEVTNCKNIYLMVHDTMIIGAEPGFQFDNIKRILYKSEFQKNILAKKYGIADNKFRSTFEGINQSEYDKYSVIEKKNRMVYSNSYADGLRWIIENVFKKIRKEVPDFEIDICIGNNSYLPDFLKQDGIIISNNVTKTDFIKKQCESKIWIYPNHGYNSEFNRNDETFCITAVENAYAKNACVFSDWGCLGSVFNGYSGFVGNYLFDDKIEPMSYENLDKFAEILVDESVKCLTDEAYRISKVESSYSLAKKYTWKNAVDDLECIFKEKDESKDITTLVCCIGRLENQYIREFVEYYKNIGFTNICLYDNNRDGEDDFHDVIGDYIDNGYVILKNYRNITTPCQFKAYNECYAEYGGKYDWIAFFDIDEFIFMNGYKNIREFLSNKAYNEYDMIHLNWLLFGDGDNVYNEKDKPLLSRITKYLDINLSTGYNIPDTFHIKSIIRGGLKKVTFAQTPHTPIDDGIRCCNSYGNKCESKSPFAPYDFRNGGILHFTTKTAEEYANKVNRGFCDGNPNTKQSLIELFFKRNKITKEKVNLFKEKTGVDASYLLPYDGIKNDEIKIYSLCYSRKGFKFLDDSVVTPLQVGASNGTDVCTLKDNVGENISSKNYFYIESTGTYWIWKNVNDVKYKGQMQYRRPLSGVCENMNFDEIFSEYDVITCEPFNHPANSKPTKEQPMCIPARTVEEGYKFSNCIDDLYILELVIKTYYPDYIDDYIKYIKNGENLYYSNGFIMKSEDFNRYSEFLFDCLGKYLQFTNINSEADLREHVRYNLEVGKYIRYDDKNPITEAGFKWQTEIGGFLSERIWTLWVQHNFNDEKIYKLPYIKMEDNMYT